MNVRFDGVAKAEGENDAEDLGGAQTDAGAHRDVDVGRQVFQHAAVATLVPAHPSKTTVINNRAPQCPPPKKTHTHTHTEQDVASFSQQRAEFLDLN